MARKNKPTLDHSDIKRICSSIVWAVFLIASAYNPKAFWSVVLIILGLLCVLIDGKVYAPYEGEWPEWAKDAQKKLEE